MRPYKLLYVIYLLLSKSLPALFIISLRLSSSFFVISITHLVTHLKAKDVAAHTKTLQLS